MASLDDLVFNPFVEFLKTNSLPAERFISYITQTSTPNKMHTHMYKSFLFELYCRWTLEEFVTQYAVPLIPVHCADIIVNTPKQSYKFFSGQWGNITCSELPSHTQKHACTFTELDIVYEYKTSFQHTPILFEVTMGRRSNVTKKQGRRLFAMKLLYDKDPFLCVLIPGQQAAWTPTYKTLYVPINTPFTTALPLFVRE